MERRCDWAGGERSDSDGRETLSDSVREDALVGDTPDSDRKTLVGRDQNNFTVRKQVKTSLPHGDFGDQHGEAIRDQDQAGGLRFQHREKILRNHHLSSKKAEMESHRGKAERAVQFRKDSLVATDQRTFKVSVL
ncbi:hypothetical protein AVEN_67923-1 [Araneus ventricosus]|uniref:Uncharacterized protein n=1 Tax=Araneus ventricosus TaxID=182803 RepID=A0A4Y2TAG8_ARAVE|nr:hypothetical protein AVEN_67923-1 [Araneus ventricosus]